MRRNRWSRSSECATRLISAILLEQNDEWALQRARYMTLENITPVTHDTFVKLPPRGRVTKTAQPAGDRDTRAALNTTPRDTTSSHEHLVSNYEAHASTGPPFSS